MVRQSTLLHVRSQPPTLAAFLALVLGRRRPLGLATPRHHLNPAVRLPGAPLPRFGRVRGRDHRRVRLAGRPSLVATHERVRACLRNVLVYRPRDPWVELVLVVVEEDDPAAPAQQRREVGNVLARGGECQRVGGGGGGGKEGESQAGRGEDWIGPVFAKGARNVASDVRSV